MVQANQHVIVDGEEAMVLDPGGHKVHTELFARLGTVLPIKNIRYLFFSHQDPDIIAATNAWLMLTDASAMISKLWMRFITHFGVDELVQKRIEPIPDEGMTVKLGATELQIIPAHFLHSSGNFQVYDPTAKILYSGDLGASLGHDYAEVSDFDAHIAHMKGFHERYMPCQRALELWANRVRNLDIEIIAPQHGAHFPNRELSGRFVDWAASLKCGVDLLS